MARIGGGSKKFANGLTPLQERFAVEYMKHNGDASAAFRAANPICLKWKPQTVWCRANKMLAKGQVKARIDQFRAEAAKRNEVTVDSLAKELDEAAQLARDIGQPGVVVSAVLTKARMYGLIVDRKEIKHGQLDNVAVEDIKAMEDAISAYRVRATATTTESERAQPTSH
jgi:phage terminase small subunit